MTGFQKLLTVAALLLLAGSPACADGDVEQGAKIFKRCMACHSIEDTANKTGPYLKGISGRKVGSAEGYARYSVNLQSMNAEGKLWDDALLDAYLTNPKAVAPAGTMAFSGLRKPEDRLNLIAYLKSKP